MGASLSFKDTVKNALWQLHDGSQEPCTSNSCQFHQEFLKAQLRRTKNQLRILENQVCHGDVKRETTFGVDQCDSPIVKYKTNESGQWE